MALLRKFCKLQNICFSFWRNIFSDINSFLPYMSPSYIQKLFYAISQTFSLSVPFILIACFYFNSFPYLLIASLLWVVCPCLYLPTVRLWVADPLFCKSTFYFIQNAKVEVIFEYNAFCIQRHVIPCRIPVPFCIQRHGIHYRIPALLNRVGV